MDVPEHVAAIIRHCPNLQEISIANGEAIYPRCIVEALAACPDLRKMDWRLTRRSQFDEADMIRCHAGWPSMRTVRVQRGEKPITAATVLSIIQASPNLESLFVVFGSFDEACLRARPKTMRNLVLSGATNGTPPAATTTWTT